MAGRERARGAGADRYFRRRRPSGDRSAVCGRRSATLSNTGWRTVNSGPSSTNLEWTPSARSTRSAGGYGGLAGPKSCSRPLDVVVNRGHELLERVEPALLADRAPQLNDQPLAVQIAVEIEQMRLDPPLDAVEMRVRPDRHRRAPVVRPARIDAVRRNEERFGDVQVRGGKPELTATSVTADDNPLNLRRSPEQRRGGLGLAGVNELPDAARGDILDERHPPHIETEPLEQREIALTPAPEAKRLAGGDGLGADLAQHPLGKLSGRERREPLVETEHEHVVDSRRVEKLEPSLQRGEELDLSSQYDAGIRIEGHDARPQASAPCSIDHAEMAAVHAVEGADGDRAPRLGQLGGLASDVHTRSSTSP